MTEILPCPFCAKPGGLCELAEEPGSHLSFWVNCSCGVETPERRTKAEAIAVWNTRIGGAWQSIETMPPAGTVIDVWMVLPSGHGSRWTSVMWGDVAQRWIGGPPSQDIRGWRATHWMPVPEAPSVSSNDTRAMEEANG
jgi:hypothetical protein